MSETTPMRPALKRQTTTARLQSAKKSTDNKMQSLSMWTSPLTEPVEWPTLHLLAFVLYGAGMIYYIVTASIAWANYERPVLFETQPTSNFDVVPLNFSIDCRDCRRFVSRQPDSRLWTLSWDYTDVPGGCAERNPELFDAELVALCAAQHDATLFDQARSGDLRDDYYAIPFAQCPNAFDYTIPYTFTMGGVTQYAPASLQRTPQGEPNVTACMERCSNTAGCVGFGFTNVTFRDARFGVDFPAGSCALLSAQKCTLFDPVDTIAGPVTVYYKKLPPSGTPPPNPLDKCSITSGDVGMFAQRASLDPSVPAACTRELHAPDCMRTRELHAPGACMSASACNALIGARSRVAGRRPHPSTKRIGRASAGTQTTSASRPSIRSQCSATTPLASTSAR